MKSEAETRKELIDKKLKDAGWDVHNLSRVSQEFDISVLLPEGVAEPRTLFDGHQFSDYVLLGRDAKPLAVVDAKKTSKDAEVGRETEPFRTRVPLRMLEPAGFQGGAGLEPGAGGRRGSLIISRAVFALDGKIMLYYCYNIRGGL
jgi:hypothetical protein